MVLRVDAWEGVRGSQRSEVLREGERAQFRLGLWIRGSFDRILSVVPSQRRAIPALHWPPSSPRTWPYFGPSDVRAHPPVGHVGRWRAFLRDIGEQAAELDDTSNSRGLKQRRIHTELCKETEGRDHRTRRCLGMLRKVAQGDFDGPQLHR
jgi:hypothetical protein